MKRITSWLQKELKISSSPLHILFIASLIFLVLTDNNVSSFQSQCQINALSKQSLARNIRIQDGQINPRNSAPVAITSHKDDFIPISEIDMRYNLQTPLIYNGKLERYVSTPDGNRGFNFLSLSYLKHAFLPSSVTDSYYRYIRWRIIQRYINAVVHVIGTQSLLIGLGLKSTKVGFASASLTWVCKDALGKVARMIWASKMGGRFDSDAKRWRFRSSIVFAIGNGLEICALAFPKLFLVWAALSNAMKQMSMLTSSATRNALYNSFSQSSNVVSDTTRSSSQQKQSRGDTKIEKAKRISSGGGENIGDITAKGEAQIAVVDLLGIASGICLSKIIGVEVRNVLLSWIFLQICEVGCMYKEIRSVVFRVLNFERMWNIVRIFVELNFVDEESIYKEMVAQSSTNTQGSKTLNGLRKISKKKILSYYSAEEKYRREFIPTPDQMASKEKIFLPPDSLARRANSFGSLGRAKLNPEEVKAVMDVFKGDKFLLFVGKNIKHPKGKNTKIEEHCHVVLHKDASNTDIVKSTLALGVLRHCLSLHYNDKDTTITSVEERKSAATVPPNFEIRTEDCLEMLQFVKHITDAWFPRFLKSLQSRGWATPARYMFGKVTMRADWPIQSGSVGKPTIPVKSKSKINSSNTPQLQTVTQVHSNDDTNSTALHSNETNGETDAKLNQELETSISNSTDTLQSVLS